jgi:hypothetical protein
MFTFMNQQSAASTGEHLILAMSACGGQIPACMRGQNRRRLLIRLAAEGVVPLCDSEGSELPNTFLQNWTPQDDAKVFVATSHVAIIAQEIMKEAPVVQHRLAEERRLEQLRRDEESREAEVRRAEEIRQADLRQAKWLASLPRLNRSQAAEHGLATASSWHRAGFVAPTDQSEAVALLNNRYFLFPQPELYRVGGRYEEDGLRSRSSWRRQGRIVKSDAEPKGLVNGRWGVFEVFAVDQTTPFPPSIATERVEALTQRLHLDADVVSKWDVSRNRFTLY